MKSKKPKSKVNSVAKQAADKNVMQPEKRDACLQGEDQEKARIILIRTEVCSMWISPCCVGLCICT